MTYESLSTRAPHIKRGNKYNLEVWREAAPVNNNSGKQIRIERFVQRPVFSERINISQIVPQVENSIIHPNGRGSRKIPEKSEAETIYEASK